MFEEAERLGGLQMGESAKALLFCSRTAFADKVLAGLRLKVNGDPDRWREMVQLQLMVSNNELAATKQHSGYRNYYEDQEAWPREQEYDRDNYYEDVYGYYDEWYDEVYDEDDDWCDEDGYQCGYGGAASSGGLAPLPTPPAPEEDYWQDNRGGKGDRKRKGKGFDGKAGGKGGKKRQGDQCAICGSRWHYADTCPLKDAQNGNQDNACQTDDQFDQEECGQGRGYRKGDRKGKRRGSGKSYDRDRQRGHRDNRGHHDQQRRDLPRFGRSHFQQRPQKGKGRGEKGFRSEGKGNDRRRQGFYRERDQGGEACGSYATLPAIHEYGEPDDQASTTDNAMTAEKHQDLEQTMTRTPASAGARQFMPAAAMEKTPARTGSAYDDISGDGE